jgi:hypothetical protein
MPANCHRERSFLFAKRTGNAGEGSLSILILHNHFFITTSVIVISCDELAREWPNHEHARRDASTTKHLRVAKPPLRSGRQNQKTMPARDKLRGCMLTAF